MSTDMFPDSANEYLVLHQNCPPDHSTCLVVDEEIRSLGKLHGRQGMAPVLDHQLYRLGYEEGQAIQSGTSSADDVIGGYDSGSNVDES